MLCLNTTTFSMIVQGKLGNNFQDIRTFLLSMPNIKAGIFFMSNRERLGIDINLTKDSPNIPYLMFAHDCLIFCRANKQAARLDYYCKISSQQFHFRSAKFNFQRHQQKVRKEITDIKEIAPANSTSTYLSYSNVDKSELMQNFKKLNT